jgi:hypothetical protein
MNLKKIENLLKSVSDILNENAPTNQEFVLMVGNMLRSYSIVLLNNDKKYTNMDVNNADEVSLAMVGDPYNIALNLLMQSHVLIKISVGFKDE